MRKKQLQHKDVWPVQEAKAKFSAMVKEAARRPQVITVNGRPQMVALSYRYFWAVIIHYFTGKDILKQEPESLRNADQIMRQAMKDAEFFLTQSKL